MLHQKLVRGKPREYLYPDDFLAEADKYFEWCIEHPLQEEQVYQYKGSIVRTDRSKVRAFTKVGLCTFLGVPTSRLETYRARGAMWATAVELVEQTIYNQKFENAAANLMNAAFIGRDLGLADKQELSGPDGGPIQTEEVTAGERIRGRIAGLASRIGPQPDTSGDDGSAAS